MTKVSSPPSEAGYRRAKMSTRLTQAGDKYSGISLELEFMRSAALEHNKSCSSGLRVLQSPSASFFLRGSISG